MKYIVKYLLAFLCVTAVSAETLVVEADMYVTGSTVVDAPTHTIGVPEYVVESIICNFDSSVTTVEDSGYTYNITLNDISAESGRVQEGDVTVNGTQFLLIPQVGDQKLLSETNANRFLKVISIDTDAETIELAIVKYDQSATAEVALEVNGDTRLNGKVILSTPQGGISMGIFAYESILASE